MEREIGDEVLGPQGVGIERLLEESPFVATKRGRLTEVSICLRTRGMSWLRSWIELL